jgi:hypothetical protein
MAQEPMTTEKLITKAKALHGNRYIYDKTKFVSMKTKITVTCRIHGDYEVAPQRHYLVGANCPKCAIITGKRSAGLPYIGVKGRYRSNRGSYKILSNRFKYYDNTFILQANKIHNNKYSYILPSSITNVEKDKFLITCPEHGEFKQTIRAHLQGQGCPKCGIKKACKVTSLEEFVKASSEKHSNKYDYSKVSYTTMDQKVTIVCPIHGEFNQNAGSHKRGAQCPKCSKPEVSTWKPEYWKDKNTIFYILSLPNSLFKIGITSQTSVAQRYHSKEKTEFSVVFEHGFIDGYDAREFEVYLLNTLKSFKYKGPEIMTSVKNSEILTIDPTSIVKQLLVQRLF